MQIAGTTGGHRTVLAILLIDALLRFNLRVRGVKMHCFRRLRGKPSELPASN